MNIRNLLVALLLTFSASILSAQTATVLRLTGTKDAVFYDDAGNEVAISNGQTIPVGAIVEVKAGTKLFLKTFEGTITIFDPGSVFEIEALEVTADKKEKTVIDLQSGDLVASLDPRKRSVNDYGVKTPKGVAAARGTQYSVSVNGVDVVVTVVGGTVELSIPDVGTFNLTAGQGSSGGAPSALASLISGGGETANVVKTALQATAAAVSTLVASGEEGVSSDALTSVIATTGAAAQASGDTTLLAATSAAASTAATEVKVAADAALADAQASGDATAIAAAQSAANTAGTASKAVVRTVVQSAVAADPTSATQLVSAVANAVTQTDASADTAEVINEVTTSANETIQTVAPQNTPTVQQSDVTEAVDEGDVTETEVPVDQIEVAQLATFTLRLSGGRLVAVTVNDLDDVVNVRTVTQVVGTPTAQLGDGSALNFAVPQEVLDVIGSLSGEQRAAILSQLTDLLGVTITVPNNSITVSPSS
ncbi:MAG: hypothetical protein SynsKO_38720 [Synoicihabitans sp.]